MRKLQRKLTKQLEEAAYVRLGDEMVILPRDDPERMAFMSVDSYSVSFMGLPPTPVYLLTNRELVEVVAMFLGLPSPACKAHVRHPLKGGRFLDDRGHLLLTTSYGSEWHDAHEIMQVAIETMLASAGIQFTPNPLSEFLPLVAQRERFIEEATVPGKHTIRHVIIPDFTYEAEDRVSRCMSDIKRLYPGLAYSSPNAVDKQRGAVIARQQKVHSDYHAAAARADVNYNGRAPGTGGPISSYLIEFGQIQGWVFGAFGEASPQVRELVAYASRRAGVRRWAQLGCDGPVDGAALHKSWFKELLGIASWRGLARLKLRNLGHALAGDFDRTRSRIAEQRGLEHMLRRKAYLRSGPERFGLGP